MLIFRRSVSLSAEASDAGRAGRTPYRRNYGPEENPENQRPCEKIQNCRRAYAGREGRTGTFTPGIH